MVDIVAPEQPDTLEGVPPPSQATSLYGHDDAQTALAAAYREGRLAHAYLLTGTRGIGKATLAFRLAHHLLSNPDASSAPDRIADPDPESPAFRQIAAGAHPSLLHLTRPPTDSGKGFKTVLTVDEIRRIGRLLSLKAHDGSYRVVIVDPADDMNANAANALLKSLEEPPSRTVFLLVSHAPGSLLPTIRSRCQVLRLAPLAEDDMRRALASLAGGEGLEPALVAAARGSVRQALLLAEHGGMEIVRAVEGLAARPDAATAHKLADVVAARGGDRSHFDLFNEAALDLLADRAAEAARSGDAVAAARLADAWQATRNAVSEADAFNLDRKQHALNTIGRLNAAMRM